MQVKIGITFHRDEINLFRDEQIICEGIHFWQKFKYKIDYLPKIG